MKRHVAYLLALLLVTASAAGAAEGRKKRIAILDFEYGTVRTAVSGLFGTDVDVGRGISDLLVKHLVKDGSYSVIERHALEKILKEQNFSNSDRANPSSAAAIGKMLGVDAIIVGSITQFGTDDKKTKVGGFGGKLGGFGAGGFGRSKSKAIVAIDARVVDIDTGEILAVADGKGEAERSGTSILGGGGGWGGFGGGGVDFSSSNFQETILGEAINAAVATMSQGVIGAKDRLVARTIKVEGLVAFIDGATIVLNVGSKSGLKSGDRMDVERITQEIKDPSSGAILRRLTSKLGKIEITDIDEGSAVARIVEGQGFKVGDLAKTTTQ